MDPDLDLWKTVKPFLENWMQERMGPRSFAHKIRHYLPRWAEQFPDLPNLVQDLLRQAGSGRIQIQLSPQELDQISREIRRANRRSFHAVVGGALVVSAALILGLDGLHPTMLGDAPLLTWMLGGLGMRLLISAWPADS